MTDAQWFAEGKQLLLVQINAADQTKRVGNMLSGILKRDETEKQAPATTPDAASLSPPSDQAQQAGVSPEKLERLYRYIEQYGKSGEEEQAASTGLTGMGDTCRSVFPVLAPPNIRRRKGVCFLRWRSVQNRFCH